MNDYRLQTAAPLHPKTLWNRPITKKAAGKLLLIGGHPGNFGLLQAAHEAALAAGAGECGVLLPGSLQKVLAGVPDISFASSNASGSLGKAALDQILKLAEDYDAVVLGLNLSNNSETAVLVEALLTRLKLPIVVTGETLLAVKFHPQLISDRPNTLIVSDMLGLYRLAGRLKLALPSGSGLEAKVAVMAAMAAGRPAYWLHYDGEMIASADNQFSVTPTEIPEPALPMLVAALGVMWMQHLRQPQEAITTAAFLTAQAIAGADIPITTTGLTKSLSKELARFSE